MMIQPGYKPLCNFYLVNWVNPYVNPFVHAVGPKVLPAGEGVQHYWDTLHAPYPWPWEIWEVQG